MEPENEPSTSTIHCYCSTDKIDFNMLTCLVCRKRFHRSCLKSECPSDLAGDIYFEFTCATCSSDGNETIKRMKLQWILVIMIALYNLQIQGGGKCGYFRWREHICRFIDKNWTVLFGSDRKKSATWHGTVAGCLSTNANKYFMSGMEVLGENGWWTLKSSSLPSMEDVESLIMNLKPNRKRKIPTNLDFASVVEGSRKKNHNIVEAAVALKEKKASIVDDLRPAKPKKKRSDAKLKTKISAFPPHHTLKIIVPKPEPYDDSDFYNDVQRSVPKIVIKSEKCDSINTSDDVVKSWMEQESEGDVDINIQDMPEMFDFPNLLDVPDTLNTLLDDVLSEISCDKTSIKSSIHDYESEEESSNSSKTIGANKKSQHPDTSRKRKAVTKDESPVKEVVVSEPKYTMMSPYEEEQLLQKLENHPGAMKERPELRRLFRKLTVRKLKREHNIPVFDLDAEVRSIRGMDPPDYSGRDNVMHVSNTPNIKPNTILDRYLIAHSNMRGKSQQYSSFITRLMGLEDEYNESIVSPYTERILKPFIFRDFKTKPLKLCLLQELMCRSNKDNPNWTQPKQSSIDYCYVRPQHIPAVNALCQEFFWPGIDLSESLQYPDFSCIALYRKVVIGFAFMVPDVKYNEAYITFIFTHPEWRRAGIATFMLYHLIQTCMGKDVTLHVSATSSAIFLYQKFGFKVEEFIHDFYDKYLPQDSKECRHALFLRLSR